ncbi:MAG: hypothetical protein BGO10_00530 [Chlamydia sp. 32-24]|nr:MAG: hypothetical protein BGO10_00530 [Chlamydia sp. 32-24]
MNDDTTLVDNCFQILKKGIITGMFAPGEKLRVQSLSATFDIGPTPIREALSRLSTTGLVEIKSNRGFYVKTISESEILDIYETFKDIELLAIEKALLKGDSNWEANILAKLHKLSSIEKDYDESKLDDLIKANFDFHYSIIEGCLSPCLLNLRQSVYQLFDRYCYLSLLHIDDLSTLNSKEHRQMADAALARDKEKLFKLTTSHLQKSLKAVLKALQVAGFSHG